MIQGPRFTVQPGANKVEAKGAWCRGSGTWDLGTVRLGIGQG
jgi:hypothetical protein